MMYYSRIFCIVFAMMVAIIAFHPAEAAEAVSVSTAADLYYNGDFVMVFGNVNTIFENMPITIQIYHETNLIDVAQVAVAQDGMYTISAHQGTASSHQKSAEVEIIDGHVIPEFGIIAAMILAIAIVSIIVVTAKTKLSIVPRY